MASQDPPFNNLIRFLDENQNERYGDVDGQTLNDIVGSTVSVLEGNLFDLHRSSKTATVTELLSPLPSTPIFICIGLNYSDHAKEANLPVPPNPVIFYKPPDAMAGPDTKITIPTEAHLMDYEGELCIIISKTGKNIPESEARSHILGFTAGNDVSSRHWQRAPRSGGQFSYAKSFDNFAPIGPTIVHQSLVTDEKPLRIQTRVNGETRQNGLISDMIFSIEKIVSHASQGTTLRPGTVIMTGTPSGIAAKMPGEPWLKAGDVVEVEIDRIGVLRNELV